MKSLIEFTHRDRKGARLKKANSSQHMIVNRPPRGLSSILEPMTSLLSMFRLRARIPVVVLLMAIWAPLLVGLLPTPAMSIEQQLLSDIALSYCARNGEHQQSGDHNQSSGHHECCILCASPAHVLVGSDAAPIFEAILQRLKQPEQHAALHVILKDAPALEWASPRGPPTNLPV